MRREVSGASGAEQGGETEQAARSALSGQRCLLLRSEQQSGKAASLLRERGAVPVVLPLLEILPPPEPARLLEAARAVDGYDLVAFTSENAVERFFDALDEVGGSLRGDSGPRIAAIGRATARALELRGLRPDVMPRRFVGEDFAAALLDALREQGGPAHKRVLLPRALVARELVPEELRRHGVEVDVVPAYETRRASPETLARLRELLGRGEIDVVLLSSSSMVESFVEAFEGSPLALPWQVVLASIGEITTATAERLGLTIDVTAEDSTMAGLVTAVERLLVERRERC